MNEGAYMAQQGCRSGVGVVMILLLGCKSTRNASQRWAQNALAFNCVEQKRCGVKNDGTAAKIR
jgi:hypothetical protein